jgi:hypothetical protein
MRAEITDTETLRSLRPLDIASYLHATGWQSAEDIGDRASLWVLPDVKDAEVLVPMRQAFSDFGLRVSEILQTLGRVERRSQLQIFSDVASVWSDLVRVRAADRDIEHGTLPLNSGVSFIEGARDIVLAAACSTVVRRGNFARRKPTQANEYMERVRLGQTERGSFVLTLHCPVTPMLRPVEAEGFFPEEPFERKVTRSLMGGLAAVRNAAQHAAATGDFAPFKSSVAAGVSANLCAAIVRLGGVVPETGVEISMAWSRSRGPAADLPQRITIEPDSFPVIQEAARIFRETEPQDDFQLVGFIGQLRRPESDPIGRVTVTSLIEDQARRVTVDLPEGQYGIAVDAHNRRKTISCMGELVKEGRSYKLLSPRDLHIIEDEDDDFAGSAIYQTL